MDKQIVTMYLKSYPHHVTVEIEEMESDTTFKIYTDQPLQEIITYIDIEFEIESIASPDPALKAVEGEYLARKIWETIQEQLYG